MGGRYKTTHNGLPLIGWSLTIKAGVIFSQWFKGQRVIDLDSNNWGAAAYIKPLASLSPIILHFCSVKDGLSDYCAPWIFFLGPLAFVRFKFLSFFEFSPFLMETSSCVLCFLLKRCCYSIRHVPPLNISNVGSGPIKQVVGFTCVCFVYFCALPQLLTSTALALVYCLVSTLAGRACVVMEVRESKSH